jgi:hypothetical protein
MQPRRSAGVKDSVNSARVDGRRPSSGGPVPVYLNRSTPTSSAASAAGSARPAHQDDGTFSAAPPSGCRAEIPQRADVPPESGATVSLPVFERLPPLTAPAHHRPLSPGDGPFRAASDQLE